MLWKPLYHILGKSIFLDLCNLCVCGVWSFLGVVSKFAVDLVIVDPFLCILAFLGIFGYFLIKVCRFLIMLVMFVVERGMASL